MISKCKLIRYVIMLFCLNYLIACDNKSDSGLNKLSAADRMKHKQYVANGRTLYLQFCSNCHQKDGTGLGQLYPPLKNSDYMKADVNRTAKIIKYGWEGEIIVNGIKYDQSMPPNPKFTPLHISEIMAYIYKEFADTTVLLNPNEMEILLLAK